MYYRRYAVAVVALVIWCGSASAQWLLGEERLHLDRKASSLSQSKQDAEAGPEAAQTWYYRQRAFGLGYIPKDGIHNALEQVRSMRSEPVGKGRSVAGLGHYAQAASAQWSLVGPSNIGGRVNTIAIDPTDPKTAYLGAANGGIWKTTDGGNGWAPLTDNSESLAMGAIAIDPQHPSTLYAGTGEYVGAIDAYTGYGLMKSTDAGKSWFTIGPLNVAGFSKIIVHPKNSNVVYAAGARSGGGLLKTTDGGKTWARLSGGLPNGDVTDLSLVMDGSNTVLYAGCAFNGLYLSKDGGDNWTQVKNWIDMRRINCDALSSDWKSVAVVSINANGELEEVDRSLDGGKSWTDIGSTVAANAIYTSGGSGQGWYDSYIRFDPKSSDRILLGGVSIWLTEDGGSNWTDAGLAYRGGVHPDQHALEFAPSDPSIVYAGNDGGLYLSSDAGSSYSSQSSPIAITEFYGIGIDQSIPDLTYGGTQDNGSLTGSATADWNSIAGGDGSYTLVDPNQPSRIFLANTQNYPMKIDGGAFNLQSGINEPSDSLAWLNPFAIDSKSNTLYYGTKYLYTMLTSGTTWKKQSKLYGQKASGTTIQAIDAFGDGKSVIIGTGGGTVFFSGDNGKTVTDISAGLPGRAVTSVKFSPSNVKTFYVTVSGYGAGHVYKTTTGGTSWTNISSSLPDIPASQILMDPQNPSVLYLGTDVGVFFSPDDGGVWIPYGTGLPNVAIAYMGIQNSERVLRVGTHGRSIWQAPLVTDIAGIAQPAQHTIWSEGDTGRVVWHGFAGNVKIELSVDAGATWQTIAKDVSGNLYQMNAVNLQPSENAEIRVSTGETTVTSPLFQIQQRSAGSNLNVLAELPIYLYDIGYDADLNVLWGTNFSPSSHKIYKLDPDNGHLLDSVDLKTGRENLTGIKYDPKTQHLFIHQANATTSNWFEVTKTGSIVRSQPSTAGYGTGILVRDDTLYLADRLTSTITRQFLHDLSPQNTLQFQRGALYGPRGMAYNPHLDQLMLNYTDFEGKDANSVQLLGSYLLFLDLLGGDEQSSYILQQGTNEVANVRGLEYDPRNGGTSAWITVLTGANASKLVKIALADGAPYVPNANGVRTTAQQSAELGQNYPNPFNPSTTVPYTLLTSGNVEIRLLDPMGREVLRDTKFEAAGDHERILDLSSLSSGTYVYELRVGGERIASKKMTLMK